jgi:hypothetical protein
MPAIVVVAPPAPLPDVEVVLTTLQFYPNLLNVPYGTTVVFRAAVDGVTVAQVRGEEGALHARANAPKRTGHQRQRLRSQDQRHCNHNVAASVQLGAAGSWADVAPHL